MPFKKGQSGNPGGRSKKQREIEQLAQEALESGKGNKAVAGLLKIAQTASPKDRVAAWKVLLAYAYGTPRQRVEVTGENGAPIAGEIVVRFVKAKPDGAGG